MRDADERTRTSAGALGDERKQDLAPPSAADALRRWLRQRIDAGEAVQLMPPRTTCTSESPRSPDVVHGRDEGRGVAAATAAPNAAQDAAMPAAVLAGDSLQSIATEVHACTKCRLHTTRTKAVPGVGPSDAGLVFVGEGPGADEDAQGEPFVGRAGQLLTKIIESVQLRRQDVFITNIVKCRPPGNRDPQPDEIAACEPYLQRQLALLRPRVICALGRHAAMTLLQSSDSMARLRTGTHSYGGVPVFPTYHPAALLRKPEWKRAVWEDIQKVRRVYDEAAQET